MLFCLKAPKRSPSFFFFTTIKYKDMYYLERLCVVFILRSSSNNTSTLRRVCRRARLESLITFELNTKDDDTSKEDVSAAFTTVVVVIECEDSFPPRRRRRRTRRESENGRPEWSKCSRR